jgi:membrane associated rhomboid family serine protease
MSSPITFILIAVTCVVTLLAFKNPALAGRLILWPPAIDRHKQYDRLVTYGFIHARWWCRSCRHI